PDWSFRMPILTLPSDISAAAAGITVAARRAAETRCNNFTVDSSLVVSLAERRLTATAPTRPHAFSSLPTAPPRPPVQIHTIWIAPKYARGRSVTLTRRHENSYFCTTSVQKCTDGSGGKRHVHPRRERRLMRRFTWDDLQFFLAVARNGQLASAARQLRTNHATVSRRIDR